MSFGHVYVMSLFKILFRRKRAIYHCLDTLIHIMVVGIVIKKSVIYAAVDTNANESTSFIEAVKRMQLVPLG